MNRPRTCLLALLLAALAAAAPAAAQIDLGAVELGEIGRVCTALCFGSSCDEGGVIESFETAPPFYVRGLRRADESPLVCENPGLGEHVTLPVQLQPGEALYFDVQVIATDLGVFVEDVIANSADGQQFVLPLQIEVDPTDPCPSTSPSNLCLGDDRFVVRTFWRTRFGTRDLGAFVPDLPSDDSGIFYFFSPNNWEMLIKVLDGCGVNDRFWVFYAATTNVEFDVTVTDTLTQQTKYYSNPLGNPALPIQDTDAFATCP